MMSCCFCCVRTSMILIILVRMCVMYFHIWLCFSFCRVSKTLANNIFHIYDNTDIAHISTSTYSLDFVQSILCLYVSSMLPLLNIQYSIIVRVHRTFQESCQRCNENDELLQYFYICIHSIFFLFICFFLFFCFINECVYSGIICLILKSVKLVNQFHLKVFCGLSFSISFETERTKIKHLENVKKKK